MLHTCSNILQTFHSYNLSGLAANAIVVALILPLAQVGITDCVFKAESSFRLLGPVAVAGSCLSRI